MTKEYIPNARENIAASSLPNGAEFYENRVRYYTTLNMTSMQVHELGLKEVQRIRQEMEQIIASVGFKGNFADFLHFCGPIPSFTPPVPISYSKKRHLLPKKPMPCCLSTSANSP